MISLLLRFRGRIYICNVCTHWVRDRYEVRFACVRVGLALFCVNARRTEGFDYLHLSPM